MRILILPNFARDTAVEYARQVLSLLLADGHSCLLSEELRDVFSDERIVFGQTPALAAACDLVLAIGGDGTILRAIGPAFLADKPLLGVNAGRLGFLSQVAGTELDKLHRLAQGDYALQERSVLRIAVYPAPDAEPLCAIALNDLVCARDPAAHMLDITIEREKQRLAAFRGDGLIVSAATGSTGYALSMGGPILEPTLDVLLITPIAAHSLSSRPMVIAGAPTLTIRAMRVNNAARMLLTADGEPLPAIAEGGRIELATDARRLRLVSLGESDFFTLVQKKLR